MSATKSEDLDYTKPPEFKETDKDFLEFKLAEDNDETDSTEELLKDFRDIDKLDIVKLVEVFNVQLAKYSNSTSASDQLSKALLVNPTLESLKAADDSLVKTQKLGKGLGDVFNLITTHLEEKMNTTFDISKVAYERVMKKLQGSGEGPRSGGLFMIQKVDRFPLLKQIKLDLDITDPRVLKLLDVNNQRKIWTSIDRVRMLYEGQNKVMAAWIVEKYGVLMKDKGGMVPLAARSKKESKKIATDLKQKQDEKIPSKAAAKSPKEETPKPESDE
jgi:hypothetical protein